ncbi:MAG: aminotransferase class V-fold PLP-dependent enzyme [Candidatus Eisenbacteria bacterium]
MSAVEQRGSEVQNVREALASFLDDYPTYKDTSAIDELREKDYSRLDAQGHIYLDFTGASLYSESQLARHLHLLRANVFGNPHSLNPTSMAMTDLVERARKRVLRYFNASHNDYLAIFTPNASGALRLVGEAYPFDEDARFLLTFDNHNSVNGIREFARTKHTPTTYVPVELPEMRVNETELECLLDEPGPGQTNLFAFPAQSNFSGVQHPLEWIELAQEKGWDVILDAAAYVATNRLDLSRWKPDFVPVSFYKMFGYPTGVGCLLARRDAIAKLRRPWFAGGTITVASVQGDKYYLHDSEAAFEDGTIDYLALPAVEAGLDHLCAVGLKTIHERVKCLTGWSLGELADMRHSNGRPLLHIYGPLDTDMRGGTVTMNFYDPDCRFFDHRMIESEASRARISLRTGCFCNPGGGELSLGISESDLTTCFSQPQKRLTLDDFRHCIDGKSTGAVRISFGIASNFADAYRFVEFARTFTDQRADQEAPGGDTALRG